MTTPNPPPTLQGAGSVAEIDDETITIANAHPRHTNIKDETVAIADAHPHYTPVGHAQTTRSQVRVRCPACRRQVNNFATHWVNSHGIPRRAWPCHTRDCPCSYDTLPALKTHLRDDHEYSALEIHWKHCPVGNCVGRFSQYQTKMWQDHLEYQHSVHMEMLGDCVAYYDANKRVVARHPLHDTPDRGVVVVTGETISPATDLSDPTGEYSSNARTESIIQSPSLSGGPQVDMDGEDALDTANRPYKVPAMDCRTDAVASTLSSESTFQQRRQWCDTIRPPTETARPMRPDPSETTEERQDDQGNVCLGGRLAHEKEYGYGWR